MNRRLIILRHAHSSRDDPDFDDHDRPLDARGLRDSPRVAREIVKRGWNPDYISVSSSLRTVQTLESLGTKFSEIPKSIEQRLYLPSLETLLSVVASIPENTTHMIISHNPGCEILLEKLSGELRVMTTASAALVMEKNGEWHLINLITPKNLG
ncbi:MAG: histidine phosphatase family protein [Candidatus Thermoplasmatota archaeon]|nr:histidine phosphatase family protein [Candidatus Thermoplasmatota archaeon]